MDDKYRTHPTLLKFLDEELEKRYRTYYTERFTVQTRWGCLLGIFLYGIFVILDVNLSPDSWQGIMIIRLGIVVPYLILMFWVTFTKVYRKWMQFFIGMSIIFVGLSTFALALVADLPEAYLVAVTILLGMFTYTFSGLRAINALAVSLILLLFFEIVSIFFLSLDALGLLFQNYLLVAANMIGVLAGITVEKYSRNEFIASLIISEESAKSESLLLNVLPESIATRLKNGEKVIADEFSEATVLFADITGFTDFCSKRSPHEVILMLNQVFSRFDSLVEKYDVEKIKTMGDCYIVAAGLPQHRLDHAEVLAELALDMRDILTKEFAENEEKVQMRFGVCSGPISAGVVGTKKFIYDIWGDTVNVASRIENSCDSNLIQVSDSTYQILKDKFRFNSRGEVDIKGKGKIKIYYLENRLPDEANI